MRLALLFGTSGRIYIKNLKNFWRFLLAEHYCLGLMIAILRFTIK